MTQTSDTENTPPKIHPKNKTEFVRPSNHKSDTPKKKAQKKSEPPPKVHPKNKTEFVRPSDHKSDTPKKKAQKKNDPPPKVDPKYKTDFVRPSDHKSDTPKTKTQKKSEPPPKVDPKYKKESKFKKETVERHDFNSEKEVPRKYRKETVERHDFNSDSNFEKRYDPNKKYGLVYILTSNAGGVIKVGETSVSAKSRLHSYSRKHKLKGFKVHSEYPVPLEDRQKIEKITHKKLKGYQIKFGTEDEIFECSPQVAKLAILDTIAELNINFDHFQSEIQKEIDRIQRRKKREEEEENRRRAKEEKEERRKREKKEEEEKVLREKFNEQIENERFKNQERWSTIGLVIAIFGTFCVYVVFERSDAAPFLITITFLIGVIIYIKNS